MLAHKLFLFIGLVLLTLVSACTGPGPTVTLTTTPTPIEIILNTGYDQATGTEIAYGAHDDDWELITWVDTPTLVYGSNTSYGCSPSVWSSPNPPPPPSWPADAVVVLEQDWSHWWGNALAGPNSRWISVDERGRRGVAPLEEFVYVYEFTLPLGASDMTLSMDIYADQQARILLNGNLIGTVPDWPVQVSQGATSISTSDASYFAVGNNVLEVIVTETGYYPLYSGCGVVTGFNVAGEVSGLDLGCITPPAGLVAWWPLDEDNSPSHDIIGGNHGSWVESPTPVTGKVDGALNVPDKSHINIPDAPVLNFGTGDFSIDCWIKPTPEQRIRMFIDKREGPYPAAGYGYGLYVNDEDKLSMVLGTGSSWNFYNSDLVVSPNEWSFVAAAVDRSSVPAVRPLLVLYVNGSSQTFDLSGFTSTVTNSSNFFIGRDRFHYDYDTHNFSGDIDEVELYNRALDVTELDTIFEADSGGKCKEQCQCGEWNDVEVLWTSPQGPGSWAGSCGDVVGTRVVITLGTPIEINSGISCNPSPPCQPNYAWEVTEVGPGPAYSESGATLPDSFTPSATGWNTFEVVLNAECDGTPCPPCKVTMRVEVVEEEPCQCGEWEDIEVTYWETTSQSSTWIGSCGNTVAIGSIDTGTDVLIGSSMSCSTGCTLSYTWEVTDSSGTQGPWNGTDLPAEFTPQGSGIYGGWDSYVVTLNASCDGVECPPCKVTIRIAEIQPESPCINGDVTDMAVANDGDTIYIISDGDVCKSINGGASFVGCPLPTGFVYPAVNIAVAPDNPSVLMVSDSSANEVIWLTTNCCFTWVSLGSPCAGADTLTDLAVSPAISGTILGRHYFATIADNAAGAVLTGDVKEIGATTVWTSVASGLVTGTHDYMAIQVSPNFVSDRSVCVVGAMPAGKPLIADVDYQIINIATGVVTRTVQFVPAGTTTDYDSTLAGAGEIIYADIALPSDFDPTLPPGERAYVGIGSNPVQTTDDVYRVDGPIATDLNVAPGTSRCIRSIAYSGTIGSGTLLAGEHATTMVCHTTDPASSSPTWNSATTPPTGDMDAVVGMHPNFATTDTCYAGTSGLYSGFFVSTDGGDNF